jgi:hypothetical protein
MFQAPRPPHSPDCESEAEAVRGLSVDYPTDIGHGYLGTCSKTAPRLCGINPSLISWAQKQTSAKSSIPFGSLYLHETLGPQALSSQPPICYVTGLSRFEYYVLDLANIPSE